MTDFERLVLLALGSLISILADRTTDKAEIKVAAECIKVAGGIDRDHSRS